MRVLFDSSVLVSGLVAELKNHEVALDCFLRYSQEPHVGVCSSHALAECYATLTALPLKRRIQPAEAQTLIEQTVVGRLDLVPLDDSIYMQALQRVGSLGLISGIVYDALHLVCAENQGCGRLYTYNLGHFRRLEPEGVVVTSP